MIRFINYSEQYTDALLKHLRLKNHKKLGIVKVETSYYNDMVASLNANLASGESLRVVDSFGFSDNEFKTTISKLKRSDFDAIGVYLSPSQVSVFFKQAAAQNLNLFFFGTDVFEDPQVIADAHGYMEGSVYPFNLVDTDFVSRYHKRFGNTGQIATAANGYDFAVLVGKLFQTSKVELSAGEILKKFREASPQDGITGRYRYASSSKGGQFFDFPIVVKTVRGNTFEVNDEGPSIAMKGAGSR